MSGLRGRGSTAQRRKEYKADVYDWLARMARTMDFDGDLPVEKRQAIRDDVADSLEGRAERTRIGRPPAYRPHPDSFGQPTGGSDA